MEQHASIAQQHNCAVQHLWHRVFIAVFVALAAVWGMPHTVAWAKSFDMTQVDINAVVLADGSLDVVEKRTFDFDGSFNGVYWVLTEGVNKYSDKANDFEIEEAGQVLPDGTQHAFTIGSSKNNYKVTSEESNQKITIYSKQEDTAATFYVRYRVNNLAVAWDDVAEMSYTFVGKGWEEDSQNISLTLSIAGSNNAVFTQDQQVRVWAHGPLDGVTRINDHDIYVEVPLVVSDEDADIHVTFPTSWIPQAEHHTGIRLDAILADEGKRADEANAKRQQAAFMLWGYTALAGLAAVAGLIAAGRQYLIDKKAQRPQFQDDYFRDIPLKIHPLVQATVWHQARFKDNHGSMFYREFFAAQALRLTDLGVLSVGTEERKTLLGRTAKESVLNQVKSLSEANYPLGTTETDRKIDQAFLDLAFMDEPLDEHSGTGILRSIQVKHIADADAYGKKLFEKRYNKWMGTITGEATRRFTGEGRMKGRIPLLVLGGINLALVVIGFIATIHTSSPVWLGGVALGLLAAGTSFIVYMSKLDLNQEGIELKAQLEALRAWFKDFTNLGESVPTDVVLWNKLLVMAAALGVAEEVIKQLKASYPEIYEDTQFRPMLWWYSPYGMSHTHPLDRINSNVGESFRHVFGSQASSGGGFGGGFSGGGTGGFSGNGGGGAF